MLTGIQVKKFESSENQEVVDGEIANISQFDLTQQDTIRRIIANTDLAMVITCKRDGSLYAGTTYYGKVAEFIEKIIIASGDVFANLVLKMCLENNLPVMVFHTNGTFFMGEQMLDYNVQAMLVGSGLLTDEQIYELSDVEPIVLFEQYGLEFLKKISSLADSIKNTCDYALTVTFESIVRNRKTYRGVLHTELATA